jgi:hypothetical protein
MINSAQNMPGYLLGHALADSDYGVPEPQSRGNALATSSSHDEVNTEVLDKT